MSVDCMILDQTVCEAVTSRALNQNGIAGSEGEFIDRGYLNDSELWPTRRAGGGTNPDPCYILNVSVLTAEDFVAAQPYLSGCPVKTFPDDPTFPGPYVPPE